MNERVKSVSFLPDIKYLKGITFDITNLSGTQLWQIPVCDDTKNIIYKHIPAGTKNITYIASINGQIPTGSTSSVWYYCEFSPEDDPTSVFSGYIHSEKTTNLSTIPENLEDEIKTDENPTIDSTIFNLSPTIQTLLIIGFTLPLLILIVVLILSSNRKTKQKQISNDFEDKNNDTNIQKNNIKTFEGKKFSIKDKFNDFMFSEEKPEKLNRINFRHHRLAG